jgi:biotin transporter BioY
LIYLVFFIVHLPVMLGGSINIDVWFGSLSQ